MSTALVILVAGKGTRMNSELPKVLHPIAQAPMLAHAMRAGSALEPERVVVVAGGVVTVGPTVVVTPGAVEVGPPVVLVPVAESAQAEARTIKPTIQIRDLIRVKR